MEVVHARQHQRSQQDHCSANAGLKRLSAPEQPRSQASQQPAYRDGGAGAYRFPNATREFAHKGPSQVQDQPARAAKRTLHEKTDNRDAQKVENNLRPALWIDQYRCNQTPPLARGQHARRPFECDDKEGEAELQHGHYSGDEENRKRSFGTFPRHGFGMLEAHEPISPHSATRPAHNVSPTVFRFRAISLSTPCFEQVASV